MILRLTTTKRLDSAVPSRCRCTCANIRCDVDEPMSMPTVVSSTLSAVQATSLTSSPGGTCIWSNSRSCIVKLNRRFAVGALVDELAHAGGDAVLGELLEINAVNARVLVLVLDLAAAVLDGHVHALEHVALGFGERIAQAPEGNCEIARRIAAGVEVLMEHLVGRREHHAMFAVDAHQVLGDVVPKQRKAMAGDREDVEVRPVAVRLLVGA